MNEEQKIKVFCVECKYCKKEFSRIDKTEMPYLARCSKSKIALNNFYSTETRIAYCWEVNKNNDCKDFDYRRGGDEQPTKKKRFWIF